MKNRIFTFILILVVVLLMIGCGNTPVSELFDVVESTVVQTDETDSTNMTESLDTETGTDETDIENDAYVSEITGVILDASMHNITIQSETGETLSFVLSEDGIDTTGLTNGIILGNGITLSYTGTIDGTDTSGATVTTEKDAETVCTDSEALAAAGQVILAIENDDYDWFVSECSFPLYIDSDTDETVNDIDAFEDSYSQSDILTDNLKSTVTQVNLLTAEETDKGLVIGDKNSGDPYIVISQSGTGSWLIQEIYLGS